MTEPAAADTSKQTTAPANGAAPAASTPASGAVDWEARAKAAESALTATKAEASKASELATNASKQMDALKASLTTPEGLSRALQSFAPQTVDPVKRAQDLEAALAQKDKDAAALRDTAGRFARKTFIREALNQAGIPANVVSDYDNHDEFRSIELADDFNLKDPAALKSKAEAFFTARKALFTPAAQQQSNTGTPFGIRTPAAPPAGGDAPGGNPVRTYPDFASGFNAPPDQRPNNNARKQ